MKMDFAQFQNDHKTQHSIHAVAGDHASDCFLLSANLASRWTERASTRHVATMSSWSRFSVHCLSVEQSGG